MSKIKMIATWVGIVGGGIAFFFFSLYLVDFMR
jgi:hypothetical protein